jgi:hypothetical protein
MPQPKEHDVAATLAEEVHLLLAASTGRVDEYAELTCVHLALKSLA